MNKLKWSYLNARFLHKLIDYLRSILENKISFNATNNDKIGRNL